MQTTANLGLKKPEGTDIVNIDDLNYNADILDSKAKELQDNKVDKVTGKGLSTNDYTTAEKNKLAGIASGAQTNQNAFSNVKVGTTIVAADNATDTLELAAGANITLTPDTTNDKVTIAVTNPNAFRNVKVGTTTIASDVVSDTFEMVAGTNISITPDATNDKVTINNTYSYTHPSTHPASMITEDTTHRFVSDTEKARINAADNGKFKSSTSTFTNRDTSQTFTEAFCTTSSLVTIVITGTTKPQGVWTVTGNTGSFTITSDTAETANIPFNYFIQKAVG